MKCFADENDYCRNPNVCLDLKKCFAFGGKMPEQQPRIPEFIELLDASKAIHLKKNEDYASVSNPFSNFEQSAVIASWFNDPVDKSFAVLIGTKLARIAELRKGSKKPNNESLSDSLLDLGTYCFLWGAYIIRQSKETK